MSVALDAYPQPRSQRTPPSSNAPPTAAKIQIPRMRLFSLARDGHGNVHNVMISPRIQGPAIIKDIQFAAPAAPWAVAKGVKIYVSDNDSGGVVASATTQNPSGDAIFEDLLFKYAGIPPVESPFLHGYPQGSLAGPTFVGGVTQPLDYPVNRDSFFVKVYFKGENQAIEGIIRVIEGVDLTRFF